VAEAHLVKIVMKLPSVLGYSSWFGIVERIFYV
jgi:hypothetical protein